MAKALLDDLDRYTALQEMWCVAFPQRLDSPRWMLLLEFRNFN
jgi:hypothetical protein